MARFVAKFILLTILLVVSLMTLYSIRGLENGVHSAFQKFGLADGHLRPDSRYSQRNFKKDQGQAEKFPEPVHKLPEGIKVNYPVEMVAGMREVASGVRLKDTVDKGTGVMASLNTSQGLFQMPLVPGENVVSMSLYGTQPRYMMGAIRNAELIKINFPGWKLRIYTESPTSANHGALPINVMDSLRALGVDFHFMEHREDFIPPMMWRFLVADDLWVDRFIVRDSDARLTQRDAAAVYAWIKSDKPFTCIRDHPSHADYSISGGLWGGKPQELRSILRRSWRDLMRGVPSHYLKDMDFIDKTIWPKVVNHTYCLDSVSCDKWPGAYPFPIPRYGYEHVGQVVNEHDLGRPNDLQILWKARVNRKCSPENV